LAWPGAPVGRTIYELILVNDGSRDGKLECPSPRYRRLTLHILGIDPSRNFGHQAALTAATQSLLRGTDYSFSTAEFLQDSARIARRQ